MDYVEISPALPNPTRWQKILSYLWPIEITAQSEGVDALFFYTVEHTYTLSLGYAVEQSNRVLSAEELPLYDGRHYPTEVIVVTSAYGERGVPKEFETALRCGCTDALDKPWGHHIVDGLK